MNTTAISAHHTPLFTFPVRDLKLKPIFKTKLRTTRFVKFSFSVKCFSNSKLPCPLRIVQSSVVNNNAKIEPKQRIIPSNFNRCNDKNAVDIAKLVVYALFFIVLGLFCPVSGFRQPAFAAVATPSAVVWGLFGGKIKGEIWDYWGGKFPGEEIRTCAFKRQELATSFETRSRFPELVIQEEKRVRFVVVNGLTITERSTKIGADDAEWFKMLTGRNEVAVSAGDYKFYVPRNKYRRVVSNSNSIPSLPNTEQTPTKQHMQPIPHQVQFHPLHQSHQSHINHNPQATHFMHNHQCVPEISNNQDSSTIPKHIACLQPLGRVGGHLHVLATSPAKFYDECGAPYLRETSKFCSEWGTKRLGI